MTRSLVLAVLVAATLLPATAWPHGAILPEPGLYEAFSPVLGRPVGPVDKDTAAKLPRYLAVETKEGATQVTFQPGGRVRWLIHYSRYGMVTKQTFVDGRLWTRSEFDWNDGYLEEKRVTGPGAGGGLRYTYTHERDDKLRVRRLQRGAALEYDEEVRVHHLSDADFQPQVRREIHRDGVLRRVDLYDAQDRPLKTIVGRLSGDAVASMTLYYVRGRQGRLERVERQWGEGKRRPAAHGTRDETVTSRLLTLIGPWIERHELRMLLGEPVRHSTDTSGEWPRTTDDYSPNCWLHEPNMLHYDAADLLTGTGQSCICGFCVDAALDVAGEDVLGRDEHYSRGPWIRLDGAVDVTADHEVMTPTGPRPAAELHAGDEVLAADGGRRRLRTVEALGHSTEERFSLNLRTRSGTFTAGGFVFRSESPRPCPPSGP